jgi:hypothetical protein
MKINLEQWSKVNKKVFFLINRSYFMQFLQKIFLFSAIHFLIMSSKNNLKSQKLAMFLNSVDFIGNGAPRKNLL